MIIIDTNIFSALMAADHGVEDWLETVSPSDLYTTTVTRAGIGYGILRLPGGRRRHDLQARASALFEEIADRTLSFSTRAADAYGPIVSARERAGRPISVLDAQIAAIARTHRAAVATRNVSDFEECGVAVVNPYDR